MARIEEISVKNYRVLQNITLKNIPLLSLSGRAIAISLMRQTIQAILLEKNWSCICY